MKRRIKIIMSLLCIAICISALSFSVFAASSVTMTISNTVSFTAPEVMIKINSVNVYQANGGAGTGYTYKSATPVASVTYANNEGVLTESPVKTWQPTDPIQFDSYYQYLVFVIAFDNMSGQHKSLATIKNCVMPRDGQNESYLTVANALAQTVTVSPSTSNTNTVASEGSPCIAVENNHSTSGTITIGFKLKNIITAFNGNLGFTVNFEKTL